MKGEKIESRKKIKPETPEISLQKFQENIGKLVTGEWEKQEAAKRFDSDLIKVKPDELTESDMKFWRGCEKITVDNITPEDIEKLEEYRKSIEGEKEPARRSFAAYLGNKFNHIWIEKQLKEMKNKR